MAGLASCDPDLEPSDPTGYCDPQIDKGIAAALEQQVTDPARSSDAWAAIARKVVDAAPAVLCSSDPSTSRVRLVSLTAPLPTGRRNAEDDRAEPWFLVLADGRQ